MRSLAIVAVVLAGCLHPQLVPCGDLECPGDAVCVDDAVCATQDQLAACSGAADQAPCDSTSGGGVCVDGVCVPNVCGDGVVTGGEACDGSDFATTCAELGFYGGTVACTPYCSIDDSGCVGRCGDGIVQADQGEQCDGSLPDFNCTDVGYDYGALGCTQYTCAADVVHTCARFGWTELRELPVPAKVVGDHGTLAIEGGGTIEIDAGSAVTFHPGAWIDIDMAGSVVLAATATSVDEWRAGTWTTLPAPPLAGGSIIQVVIATDGTEFALASGSSGCAIDSYDGTAWTMTAAAAGCTKLAAFAADNFVVAMPGAVAWTFPGCVTASGPCQCGHSTPAGGDAGSIVEAILAHDPTSLDVYAYTPSGTTISDTTVEECAGAPTMIAQLGTIATPSSVSAVTRGSEVFLSDGEIFGTTIYRAAYGRVEVFAGAPDQQGAPTGLFATRDGKIYTSGNGDLYELDALIPTTRAAGAGVVFNTSRLALAEDGTIVTCGQQTDVSAGSGFRTISTSAGNGCNALWAADANTVYVAVASSPTTLQHWNGSTWTTEMLGGAPIAGVTSIAGNASMIVAADGADVIAKVGTTWSVLAAMPMGCTASAVAITASGTVYAGGSCATSATSVVWQYDTTTAGWDIAYSEPGTAKFVSLSIASDATIFAASDAGRVVVSGSPWTGFDGVGNVVAAVSATSAFAARATSTPSVARLNAWDGARWTPVNADPTSIYYYTGVLATASEVGLFGFKYPGPIGVFTGFIRGQ